MGTVFAAYDLKLDRKIAVKVLHRTDDVRARSRVLREAQALAKLSHPNVVSVFATGEHDGRPYIAMEFIDGRDLDRWRREVQPDSGAIVATYLQAGRGLAAAHEVGLIHRDFKPANVMVDHRGRVKVLDFGLAQSSGEDTGASPPVSSEALAQRSEALSAALTKTGRTVGTPAYMAPEQMMAVRTDARADQFAFCVALWEAVYGNRPFDADSVTGILASIGAGAFRALPADSDAGWMEPHLRRGLASDPERRWPDMRALLDVLERGAPRRTKRWAIPVALASVAGAAALALVPSEDSCADGVHRIGQVWNETRSASVRAQIGASQSAYGAGVAEVTTRSLDDYAAAWADAYALACADTRDHGQSPGLRDARYACLERSKRAMRVLADGLERSDARALDNMLEAVGSLPVLSRCANLDLVTASSPAPATPELAAEVDAISIELEAVEQQLLLGEASEASAAAESLASRAGALGHPPTRVAIYRMAARVALDGQDGLAAARWAEAAYVDALEVDPATTVDVHLLLARAYIVQELYQSAERETDVASALLHRYMPGDDELLRRSHNVRGLLFSTQQENTAAQLEFAEVLRLAQKTHGADSHAAAAAHLNLGSVLVQPGDEEAAADHASEALRIWTERFGPEHPDVARALTNLAVAQRRRGEFDAAQRSLERATGILSTAYSPSSDVTLRARMSLAILSFVRSDLDRSEAQVRAVLSDTHDTMDEHADVRVAAHHTLAQVLQERGDYEAAREEFKDALALQGALVGSNSESVASLTEGLAVLEAVSGHLAASLRLHQDVLRVRRTQPVPDLAAIADSESNVGLMFAATGTCVRALPLMIAGLEYWFPRTNPNGRQSRWLRTQATLTALCAEVEGDVERAQQWAHKARDFQITYNTEASNDVAGLAQVILQEGGGAERRRAAVVAIGELEAPAQQIVRLWLEATAPNHPLPPGQRTDSAG